MPSLDEEERGFVAVGIAVLTISDTRGLAQDRSGALLGERIEAAGHRLVARDVVKDDIEAIRGTVRRWVSDPTIDVVLTTGGTGFTGHDVTPEALEPIFEKRMDGFSIVFHRISYDKIGTSTMQSRATAGVVAGTYVFVLPGSPGACKDRLGRDPRPPARLPVPAVQFRRDHAATGRAPPSRRQLIHRR